MLINRSLKNKKVLITCGPTWIPIDEVRVISNVSTGQLGHLLTIALQKQGARVTVLEGPVTQFFLAPRKIKIIKYHYFQELLTLLKKELEKHFDIIIHAAAVSDYKLKKTYRSKLNSKLDELKLHLIPTIKIINRIKQWAPNSILVGFKLEPTLRNRHLSITASELFKKAHCDLVVANSLRNNHYHGYIINNEKQILANGASRRGIVKSLVKILSDGLKENRT